MTTTLWKLIIGLLVSMVLAACSGGGGGENSESVAASPLPSFPAHAQPIGPPPYTCYPPGVQTQAVLDRLNSFWQSRVSACACDVSTLGVACQNNGFVTPRGPGYIYYDANFLNNLDVVTRSRLPADFFMAHEFGHTIQLALSLQPPGKIRELQADCLAGFYVGFQIRNNQVSRADLINTLQFACQIGDPSSSNWWDPTHGTCGERVTAVQAGINGYLASRLPLDTCPS